jgi:hypothetical protein
MTKVVTGRLFKCFDREQAKREIEEELSFHLELLAQEHFEPEIPLAEARTAALKRFGNVEQIRDQCVQISRRSHHSVRAVKAFLILVFLSGVLVRVFSTEFHLMRVGDTLIAVAVMSRLFLYVRGLNPSSFHSKHQTSSPLMLTENVQTSIRAYDQRELTPVERVIAEK